MDLIDKMWNITYQEETESTPPPGGQVSEAQRMGSPAEELAIMILLCIFSVVGTLGNGLVLYVFTRKAGKLTSTIFILALAGTDFVTCLLVIPFTVTGIHVQFKLKYDVACKIYQFLITCNVPLSAFIMVAIAVDRYICICHPFIHIMTVRRAKIIVSILAAFAVILGLITSFSYSVYEVKTKFISSANESTIVFGGNASLEQYPKYMKTVAANINSPPPQHETVFEYSGECNTSPTLLPSSFIKMYQKVYSSFYLISLLVVLVLYGMIYSSVTKQRAKRRKQKMGTVKQVNTQCQTDESTMPLNNVTHTGNRLKVELDRDTVCTKLSNKQENGESEFHGHGGNGTPQNAKKPSDPLKERKDHNRMANIKTAVMLFIVTVVFILAFLPAWLMAHRWVGFNIVVFFMYFVYNVANPIIYAFMNQMFRDDLKRMVSSFRGCCPR